jgi:hypothetical protein
MTVSELQFGVLQYALMYQNRAKTTIYQEVYRIYQRNFGYLLGLILMIWVQIGLMAAAAGAYYLKIVPLGGLIGLLILGWNWMAIYTLGVGKNITAVVKKRGQRKYPLLAREYWWAGNWLLFFYSVIFVLPWVGGGAMIAASNWWPSPWWWVGAGVIWVGTSLLQWRWGLAGAVMVDKNCSLLTGMRSSWRLTRQRRWQSAGFLGVSYVLLVGVSVFLPVIGTILVTVWMMLSGAYLCQVLWREKKGGMVEKN